MKTTKFRPAECHTSPDAAAELVSESFAPGDPKFIEAIRALRKRQARAFQLQPGIRSEVRLVERAFGIGPDMMSELMSLHGAELERIAIQQGY